MCNGASEFVFKGPAPDPQHGPDAHDQTIPGTPCGNPLPDGLLTNETEKTGSAADHCGEKRKD